ncbi:MAG TPA: DUF302 domain-containing protein [Holophaga sp.]|nr:DUF302 domain-containing protein [Holophaga sp.]
MATIGTTSQGESPASTWKASRHGFEATLERLRLAIGAEGLWLIHEIDTQGLVAREGHAIPPLRQLLFFHPRFLIRLLEECPGALTDAPLRVIVRETPGGGVEVGHPGLSPALGEGQGCATMGGTLRGIYGRVVETACC